MSETWIIDLKELETKVENGKGFNHKEATVLLEFVRKIISNGGTVQPQLTIPQSIAEQADKTDLDTLFKWGQQEFYQWFNHEQDEYMPIIYAYLAGKALGVDLVRVVEG
ncbi:hypothetical protein E34_1562 [Lactococcus lactis subsp. lactis]|uniref:hypothetical protein n=1 Tax=Lactococcus lactis TaxID=1358 RepID=UPI00071DDA6D|nr:hypothetical protein [Lactococcus lactis]KST78039.1 hypothetical protein E34_1562 [Lactococcus lactis subsp. lactis]